MSDKIKEFQAENGLVSDGIIGRKTIQAMRCKWGIQTDAQMANFLSQVHHETGGFTASVENLNYSEQTLLKVFPKYFGVGKLPASQYARKPEAIANVVYANRMGNGNTQSGDGWKYRGRGALQLTGKDNYKAFSAYVSDPNVITNPELVGTKYYWESALFYFTRNNLWNLMKGNTDADVKAVRKAVNGGYIGLNDVQELFDKYYKMITG